MTILQSAYAAKLSVNPEGEQWLVQGQKGGPESCSYINMAFGLCFAGMKHPRTANKSVMK